MARVHIVLVRPESAANVGACARVVRNAGAEALALVRPGDWRTVECWRSAWGAQDVLEEARVFEELAPALAGSAAAYAFTRRRPREPHPLDVREAAAEIATLGRQESVALVFGPETSGLSNEEIGTCGRSVSIPSHPSQPSFNLSHAVAIAAYEVHRAGWRAHEERPRRATHDEKERLLDLLRPGLRALGALPQSNSGSYFADWRALVQRVDLSAKELKLLEHLARKMAAVSSDD